MNKRSPLKTAYRYISWQVYKRLYKNRKVVPFINDVSLIIAAEYFSTTGQYYEGLAEWNPMLFLLRYLDDSDVFYDIGANAGVYTLLSAGVCRSRTAAFEPDNTTFNFLKEQLTLNNLEDRVQLFNAALGATKGTVHFSQGLGQTNHVIGLKEDQASTAVDMLVLDDIAENQQPNVIKIDVEGYEWAVLQGASKTLANEDLNVVITEEMGMSRRYDFNGSDLDAYMNSFGFYRHKYDVELNICEPTDTWQDMNIFLRDIDKTNSRLQNMKRKITLQGHYVVI